MINHYISSGAVHNSGKLFVDLLKKKLNVKKSKKLKMVSANKYYRSIAKIDRKKSKNKIILKVSDSGIGIPKEKQNIIWDEFRQVSEGTKRRFQGSGLGLTIVKKYTEILGGKILLQSKVNAGTIFTIELPINFSKKV